MGAHGSLFAVEDNAIVKIKPSNPKWLFKHAEACGMPFSEVQRCWRRFQILGCNKKGVLSLSSEIWKSEDKFIQQALRQLPWTNKGTLSFQVYLNVCRWFSQSDILIKLTVIYGLINQYKPIDENILQRMLIHIYPEESQDNLQLMAKDFIEKADSKQQGFVDEEDFVNFAKRIPFEEMSLLLNFNIRTIRSTNYQCMNIYIFF
uniref:EF-hand domain-containing protein n=1 Tax=Ciona savignyi TaxID=51511 RepID=H2Z5M9_CIOSA